MNGRNKRKNQYPDHLLQTASSAASSSDEMNGPPCEVAKKSNVVTEPVQSSMVKISSLKVTNIVFYSY